MLNYSISHTNSIAFSEKVRCKKLNGKTQVYPLHSGFSANVGWALLYWYCSSFTLTPAKDIVFWPARILSSPKAVYILLEFSWLQKLLLCTVILKKPKFSSWSVFFFFSWCFIAVTVDWFCFISVCHLSLT